MEQAQEKPVGSNISKNNFLLREYCLLFAEGREAVQMKQGAQQASSQCTLLRDPQRNPAPRAPQVAPTPPRAPQVAPTPPRAPQVVPTPPRAPQAAPTPPPTSSTDFSAISEAELVEAVEMAERQLAVGEDQCLLPEQLRKTLPAQDRQWISRALFHPGPRGKPELDPLKVDRMWYSPPEASLSHPKMPRPDLYFAHRLCLWFSRRLWGCRLICPHPDCNQQDLTSAGLYNKTVRQIDEFSLGMDRTYMLKGRHSEEVMTYEELRRQQAVHVLGVTPSTSLNNDISDVVDFEIKLANMTASRTERRDIEKFYKKMTVSELKTLLPKFNWLKFLGDYFAVANISITEDTEIALVAEDYLRGMLDLIDQTDKRTVANYLLTRLVGGYVSYLSKDIRELNNHLRKVLSGVSVSGSRWDTCVRNLGSYFMPTAVGQLYVTTYFSSVAKDKALEMIGYIRESISQMITGATWMDEATKTKALEKADAIIQNIGYPDYQFNDTVLEQLYEDVDYQPDTYFQNVLAQVRSGVKDNCKRLLQHPSRTGWSDSASTVNAHYSPSRNTITFPAGILQPPYYAEDFPMSMMFGGIGVIIGHEISHGFDDQGRKYDKDGNLRVWWSDSSTANYEKLTSCFVQQYSDQVATGIHINGNLSLGENIADNGGIKASFTAFERWQALNGKQPALPGLGLTHEQLFFLNYAQGWCALMNEESLRDKLITDTHSPHTVRARVPMFNSEPFAKAFKCPLGSTMNPVKKCTLW